MKMLNRIALQRCSLLALLTIILFSQTGCFIAVPFIQIFKESGLTATDRQTALGVATKEFHNAYTDGDYMKVLAWARPEFHTALKQRLRAARKKERIFEIKNDYADFSEDSRSASVEAYYKYFREGYNVVEERLVAEKWEFSLNGGWKVADMETLEDGATKK